MTQAHPRRRSQDHRRRHPQQPADPACPDPRDCSTGSSSTTCCCATRATPARSPSRRGTSLFLDSEVQELIEFEEIPVAGMQRGLQRLAIATKKGLGVRVSEDMRRENNMAAINRQVTALVNTLIRARFVAMRQAGAQPGHPLDPGVRGLGHLVGPSAPRLRRRPGGHRLRRRRHGRHDLRLRGRHHGRPGQHHPGAARQRGLPQGLPRQHRWREHRLHRQSCRRTSSGCSASRRGSGPATGCWSASARRSGSTPTRGRSRSRRSTRRATARTVARRSRTGPTRR
ncbi:hypothetical protein G5V59_26940 [Nocardioides sp. W3-2-3]|nr:hypothetical protein [Nocardioides convexus]